MSRKLKHSVEVAIEYSEAATEADGREVIYSYLTRRSARGILCSVFSREEIEAAEVLAAEMFLEDPKREHPKVELRSSDSIGRVEMRYCGTCDEWSGRLVRFV